MNATARVLQQQTTYSLSLSAINLRALMLVLLMVATLASAIGVIYVKDMNRQLTADLQMAHNSANTMQVRWGQLLLEQSTLSTQARVQRVAQTSLGMTQLNPKNVIMVRE